MSDVVDSDDLRAPGARLRKVLGEELHRLREAASTAYVLDADLRMAWVNSAWFTFADENGDGVDAYTAEPHHILPVFADDIRPYYRALFDAARESGEPQEHTYECSSSGLYRKFKMRVRPVEEFLVVEHHLVVEHPHDSSREPHPLVLENYASAEGLITQCCHCRMLRRADDPHTWDWVPSVLDNPPDNVSHGLCPPCFRSYYPELVAAWDAKMEKERQEAGTDEA
jgi:hypothetical protein